MIEEGGQQRKQTTSQEDDNPKEKSVQVGNVLLEGVQASIIIRL